MNGVYITVEGWNNASFKVKTYKIFNHFLRHDKTVYTICFQEPLDTSHGQILCQVKYPLSNYRLRQSLSTS